MGKNDVENQAELASRLRFARESAGLTQGQVAKLLSLHRPTISEIEAGRRKVAAAELSKLADVYGVPVDWLLSGGAGRDDLDDSLVEMAARELSKLKKEDFERVMKVVRMLRFSGKHP